MADLRNFLKQREESKGGNRVKYDSDIYPFWNMQIGESATVRILPELGEENPFPFIERLDHKISINGKVRKIPCPSMFGDPCPICDLSQEYYGADDEENGKYYYRDSVHLCKAVVLEDPLPPNKDTGETFKGKVVTLQLGYQIMEKILEQLGTFFDPDDEATPWDLIEGYNFVIKKTKQGKDYPKYDVGSTFERRPSALPKAILKELELVELESLLPEPPSFDKVNELLDAHLNGGAAPSSDDSLESKRRKSSESASTKGKSASRAALERLSMEDDDDDDEDDVPVSHKSKRRFDEDDEDDQDDSSNEVDDDEDDDDEDLRAIIARARKSRK